MTEPLDPKWTLDDEVGMLKERLEIIVKELNEGSNYNAAGEAQNALIVLDGLSNTLYDAGLAETSWLDSPPPEGS